MTMQGFTSAYQDPVTRNYPLGHGYRMYDRSSMRFTAQDDYSPYGSGGMNAMAYCEGDPINGFDPTGHSFLRSAFLTFDTMLTAVLTATVPPIGITVGLALPNWINQDLVTLPKSVQVGASIALTVELTAIGIVAPFAIAGGFTLLAAGAAFLAFGSGATGVVSTVESAEGHEHAAKVWGKISFYMSIADIVISFGEAVDTYAEAVDTYRTAVNAYEKAGLKEASTTLERPTIGGYIARAAISQGISQALNAGLYYGLPPLMKAAFQNQLKPPPVARLAGIEQTAAAVIGSFYPSAYSFPQPSDPVLVSAHPESHPAVPVFRAATLPVRPGYPAQYAALWS